MKALITILMLTGMLALFVVPVVAEDGTPVDGLWSFTIETAQGPVTAEAQLSVDGSNVGGKLVGPSGELAIFGTWSADSVRLYALDGDGTFVFTGDRTPGAISGTAELTGVPLGAWSAKRK